MKYILCKLFIWYSINSFDCTICSLYFVMVFIKFDYYIRYCIKNSFQFSRRYKKFSYIIKST